MLRAEHVRLAVSNAWQPHLFGASGLPQRFTGHATPVRALAFHPDDSVLLSAATQDRFLNVWRTTAGKGTSGSDDAPEGAAQSMPIALHVTNSLRP